MTDTLMHKVAHEAAGLAEEAAALAAIAAGTTIEAGHALAAHLRGQEDELEPGQEAAVRHSHALDLCSAAAATFAAAGAVNSPKLGRILLAGAAARHYAEHGGQWPLGALAAMAGPIARMTRNAN